MYGRNSWPMLHDGMKSIKLNQSMINVTLEVHSIMSHKSLNELVSTGKKDKLVNEGKRNVLNNNLGMNRQISWATFSQFFLLAQNTRQEYCGATSRTSAATWSGSSFDFARSYCEYNTNCLTQTSQ